MLGSDAQGRAVLLFQVRKHNAWARKLDELERFCCYLLDMTVGGDSAGVEVGAERMDGQATAAVLGFRTSDVAC